MGKGKPGPREDRLAIKGPWQKTMKKALMKKRPAEGWPEREVQKRAKKSKPKKK